MLKNYLKIAIRSLFKDKFFSLLNVSGLAIGITCCLLIMTYVNYELSYDKHFDNHENIYRIGIEGRFNGRDFTGVQSPAPAAPTFRDQVPQVEQSLRFRRSGDWIVKYEDKVFNESRVAYADETFFEVFKLNLIQGNPEEALLRKNQVVISETMAKKYFGDEDPMGKNLKFDNTTDYMVSGVYEDIPSNSHMRFEMLMSFITRENDYNSQQWLSQNEFSYLVLNENANLEDVEGLLNEIAIDKMSVELKQF